MIKLCCFYPLWCCFSVSVLNRKIRWLYILLYSTPVHEKNAEKIQLAVLNVILAWLDNIVVTWWNILFFIVTNCSQIHQIYILPGSEEQVVLAFCFRILSLTSLYLLKLLSPTLHEHSDMQYKTSPFFPSLVSMEYPNWHLEIDKLVG